MGVVRNKKLPAQVTTVNAVPVSLTPVKNRQFSKPSGGLWTSTFQHGTSAWIEWCQRAMPDKLPNDCKFTVLTPTKARIVEIDTIKDAEQVVARYAVPFGGFYTKMQVLDWERMAAEADGFHLTSNGQDVTRYEDVGGVSFYGWDVESTIWFRWVFEKSERVVIPNCRG